ncbi:NAD(P)H-quinone oxidoreductase subunit O, chloroplastic-like isoform X1 [Zingiber officinale]|uniref:NAD(P)H-quinone oxidoreductase subunit O, chloroplastic-like isoform X1 n=1 Tax=Zingiber officinale TaxID=94328 RepID=UPI001C4A836C|nr:NAD(P)H-quinone oxidoreductase subunit O, chloroplastic-like isoform X1 [Zingiber officinale]
MASLLSPSAPLLGRDRLHLAYPSASSRRAGLHRLQPIKAFSSADPPKETPAKTTTEATKPPAPSPPKKPVYSMKKGQIVRVDKEKYLSSINYLSVDHPPYYKGLDYIYEDRGEVPFIHYTCWFWTCEFLRLENMLFTGCLGWHSHCTSMATYIHADQVGETRL